MLKQATGTMILLVYKSKSQCKILIVPEEGWFGQPKYSTPSKKSPHVVSVSSSVHILHLLSLLIGRDELGTKSQDGRIHHNDKNLLLNKGAFLWGDLCQDQCSMITQIIVHQRSR